jgi:hypothetical protein
MHRPGSIRLFTVLQLGALAITWVNLAMTPIEVPAMLGENFIRNVALMTTGLTLLITFGIYFGRSSVLRWVFTVVMIFGLPFMVIQFDASRPLEILGAIANVVSLFAIWRESATDWIKGRWEPGVA